MHYRERAAKKQKEIMQRRIKAVVYASVIPLSDGGYLFSDHSFFLTYEHKNPKFNAQQEIERAVYIRNSHHHLYNNVMYYIQGIDNYDECKSAIECWHNARNEDRISIYRLD